MHIFFFYKFDCLLHRHLTVTDYWPPRVHTARSPCDSAHGPPHGSRSARGHMAAVGHHVAAMGCYRTAVVGDDRGVLLHGGHVAPHLN